MSDLATWREFTRVLRGSDLFKGCIGLEAGLSAPVPTRVGGADCAGVLVLRTRSVRAGVTDLFKPEAFIAARLNDGRIALYENFLITNPRPEVPWNVPMAKFPHSRIQGWSRQRYDEELDACFGALGLALNAGDPANSSRRAKALGALVAGLVALVDDALLPFLLDRSPQMTELFERALAGPLRERAASSPTSDPAASTGASDKLTGLAKPSADGVLESISKLARGDRSGPVD